MLVQRRNPALRAYFVWGLYLGTDNEDRAREMARKYAAPFTVHFWTASPDISKDLAGVLRLGAGRLPFDVYMLYRNGTLWESRIPAPAYWQQQMGIVQGDLFNITKLESRIQQLLGK
jgi:hypothetical protein